MDESYYERIVQKTIRDGPYVELENNPLNNMVKQVDTVLEKHKYLICEKPERELRWWKVSNPQVACLYVLLKLHKDVDVDGDYKGRPVASNTNAPSENMAKKIVKDFQFSTAIKR